MYSATVVADSIAPSGARLTTLEVTLPRIVLAEFNTHRVFSRNSQSSRARPLRVSIEEVRAHPFVPDGFGVNRPGMQSLEWLSGAEHEAAAATWRAALADALDRAAELDALGVHKQLGNRLLEPFMWHTVLVTATEWGNFFALRLHAAAQREIRVPAALMCRAYAASRPTPVPEDGWHLPLVAPEELAAGGPVEFWRKVSVGRCARVSYLTHDGRRDPVKDVELHDRLLLERHLSPFEHVARPLTAAEGVAGFSGNFRGWHQMRKDVPQEADFSVTFGDDELAALAAAVDLPAGV